MPLLFVIEDVFAIKDRGVVACGKLADPECARYYVGDTVEIRRRDGSAVQAVISGIPMGMLATGMADVLLRGVSGSDVGAGDQVWAIAAKAEPDAAADGGGK
jgi:translation elongation factor EF-Tu-like GTPase